jgi:hypothetical protein
MKLFRFLLFAGTLIAASSAFSVPRGTNQLQMATVRLESPLIGGPYQHGVVDTATEPSGLPYKIKQWFGAMGHFCCLRSAIHRKTSRIAMVVALYFAILGGPVILPAQAHPPTSKEALEIIMKRLNDLKTDNRDIKADIRDFKADTKADIRDLKFDIKGLDRKYTFVPLASATAATVTSAILNPLT